MAADMFLDLEGIEGESTDKNHLKEIDVEGFSWGAIGGRPGFAESARPIRSGPELRNIEVVKEVDRSSPTLYTFLFRGTVIQTGCLTLRKSGKVPLPFLVIRFKNLIIEDLTTQGGGAGGDVPTERLKLSFERVSFEYTPQKQDGSAAGGAVIAAWSVPEATPTFG